jgi:hypothetical protein
MSLSVKARRIREVLEAILNCGRLMMEGIVGSNV